jgi:cytochrome c-type biogenesis protein
MSRRAMRSQADSDRRKIPSENIMSITALYLLAALYLGVLTSISPCPLATNIAAVSYVGRKVGQPRAVMIAGWLYTLGRCIAYLVLATLVAASALSIPTVSLFLQKYMYLLLGPVFLLVGILLVDMVKISTGTMLVGQRMQQRVDAMGIWGALPLGVLFALSFCPTSALWFAGLLALIVGSESPMVLAELSKVGINLPTATIRGGSVLLPLVYGVGTALPVIVIAFVLAYGTQSLARTYNVLTQTEWWARRITGWLFIVLGMYFALKSTFLLL